MKLTAEYTFEAAHRLPRVPVTHKCHRLHGHNYKIEVSIFGDVDERGFIIDYADLDAAVQPIIDTLDHQYLNDVQGLENPTSEIIAEWLKTKVSERIQFVPIVRVYETPRYWVEV